MRAALLVRRLQVFAVEASCIQVTWASLPAGPITFAVYDAPHNRSSRRGLSAPICTAVVEGGRQPGAVVIDGLPSGRDLELVALAGEEVAARRPFTTLTPPPGDERFRFATINDLHLGEPGFGIVRKLEAPELPEGYAWACAQAAMADALAWGAQALVVKGDLTWSSRHRQFEMVARLLADVPVPVMVLLGNHDVGTKWGVDGAAFLLGAGVPLATAAAHVDHPGIRLVVVPTSEAGWPNRGRLAPRHRAGALELVGDAPGPSFVAFHHHLQPFRLMTFYPPSLPAPVGQAFLRDLAAANPRTFASSGHSHRNRAHLGHPIPWTEVGSTKDYPGVWAGYAVHDGGIRQVVRRVGGSRILAWTDRTRRAAGGVWGYWSPGRLKDRCLVHQWP